MVTRAAGEPQEDAGINLAVLDESLPRQFGKYTLLRRLAAGGMAEIFLALHRSVAGFEKLIVIKRILPSMNGDRAFIEMLLHEARIAATMSHPNIVQTFDVGQVEGTYFIAMEHIHGEDIRSIVRAMRKKSLTDFPLEHAVAIATGTCAGLAYAHDKRDLDGNLLNIVHRDISPQNIVVTFSGDVKIVDFGVAKSSSQVGEDTKDGQLKGKVPYMSPEQAMGLNVDWRSDIFAAGVLLYELTTGKRLFKGSSEFETLKLIVDKDYPRPSEVKPGYPPALERIVMKALEKDREARYQSAREMQRDLESFVREERIPVSQISLTQWMQSLFQEKLEQQKETLQDIKQLADVIALQHGPSLYDGTVTGSNALSSSGVAQLPPPRRSTAAWLVAIGLVAAAGAVSVLWVRQKGIERGNATTQAALDNQKQAAPEARGSLEIKSTPEGCSIWINGDLRKEVTPAKIEGLPLDSKIELKLTKEGLEPHRETVMLTSAEPSLQINAPPMKGGSVTVALKIDPPPASVWLDGKPWKGSHDKLEGISANEEHKLVLQAPGYQPKTLTFTAEQGETKTIQEHLTKADPSAASDKPTGVTSPAGSGRMATVRVNAKGGFCNVSVNGASAGPTPTEVSVPAGTVRVSCKPASGPAMSQAIQVKPGEVGRVSFKLQ
ncbi:serine/threonine-protein kinase [Polyangium aurulentum]|uniref:serine/threonine-protein kinase n=1 Tax=Polyangium aurulentum TaxID=2567896 RepID=UPI0010AE5D00|nr:serine/threonine-protein kinase [Polyangium aurulentum]UQA59545.1 protein kinase [Polyangium aurulentum]